jgi:hypothetical protein
MNLFMRPLVFLPCVILCSKGFAGGFIFAGESNGVDVIAHPTSYTGPGGTLTVRVCIAPNSANAAAMEIPVQNNITIYNRLQPMPTARLPATWVSPTPRPSCSKVPSLPKHNVA